MSGILRDRFQGIWIGNCIFFTDHGGREHKLKTEMSMPGTDTPVTVFLDGDDYCAFDEDKLGIKIVPNYTCDEMGVSH